MPLWLQWTLIIAGLLVIALLLAFIVRHSRTLQESKKREAKTEAFQKERRASMVESIRVLAMAVEADQMEYSEACLRIKGLLDHVAPELLEQTPFRVFQEVNDLLQHMPTHRARQETNNRFVAKMDRERLAVEEKYADTIRRAATAIRHHPF